MSICCAGLLNYQSQVPPLRITMDSNWKVYGVRVWTRRLTIFLTLWLFLPRLTPTVGHLQVGHGHKRTKFISLFISLDLGNQIGESNFWNTIALFTRKIDWTFDYMNEVFRENGSNNSCKPFLLTKMSQFCLFTGCGSDFCWYEQRFFECFCRYWYGAKRRQYAWYFGYPQGGQHIYMILSTLSKYLAVNW